MKKKLIFSLFFIFVITACNVDTYYFYGGNQMIPEYQNYFVTESGQLYGLDEQGAKRINPVDEEETPITISDFFIKGGDVYFTVQDIDNTDPENPVVNETYYKQKNGNAEIISSIPSKPGIVRVSLNNEEFTIENFDYQGKACSDVRNLVTESGLERFFMVDGSSHFPGIGLYINVSDGRYNERIMVRDKGLYFWPVDKPSMNIVIPGLGVLW